MSAGMDHLGISFHAGVSPQSKARKFFPKHIKKSYANGLWQRSCGCIVIYTVARPGRTLLFAHIF